MTSSPVVRIQFGSHLYGTNTPQSDLDYKAVHIPACSEILLQRVRDSVSLNRKKNADGIKNEVGEVDEESYSLQNYLQLASQGQTVAIDMLFAPKQNLLMSSPLWEHIQDNADRLVTKKSASFVGYCRTQANKYGIKGSRVAAAKDATEFFASVLAKSGAQTKVGEVADGLTVLIGEHTRIVQQEVNRDGTLGTFLECCNRKVDYGATAKQAHEIFSRIHANYGARARLAQDNEGVDWKALSHAVRVGREAIELLTTGRITFPLIDAHHIMQIKAGLRPYTEVAEEIELLLQQTEEAAERSVLPDAPDAVFVDNLVMEHYAATVCPKAQP